MKENMPSEVPETNPSEQINVNKVMEMKNIIYHLRMINDGEVAMTPERVEDVRVVIEKTKQDYLQNPVGVSESLASIDLREQIDTFEKKFPSAE